MIKLHPIINNLQGCCKSFPQKQQYTFGNATRTPISNTKINPGVPDLPSYPQMYIPITPLSVSHLTLPSKQKPKKSFQNSYREH